MSTDTLARHGYDKATREWTKAPAQASAPPLASASLPVANAPGSATGAPVGPLPGLQPHSQVPPWALALNQQAMPPMYQFQPWSGPMFNNATLGLNAYNASAVPDYRALLGQMLGR